jgi:glycerol-3-phosphate dehydrogenase
MAKELSSFRINDIRRRTRLGMGTCQANFCALRSASVFAKVGRDEAARDSLGQMKEFLQGRWKGIRPVLLGRTIREMEMTRALYELSFNVNGGEKE